MLSAALVSIVLIAAAFFVQAHWPGSLVAVSLYKAHLMALGGWGGYWIDRVLFPYARPDKVNDMATAMLRRAIVVAACLVCVGLGA